MNKVYKIKSGDGWFMYFGRDGQPFMSSDVAEAKVMLYGEADRIANMIEAAGFVAEIVEVT